MASNRYTTKGRAKRIALHYFKWPHPFRRWKLVLSIVEPLLAGTWLVGYAARGDQRVYTSGPVSTAHAMFGDQCSACHVPKPTPEAAAPNGPAGRSTGFFVKVSDQACSTCHEGPVHHDNQTHTP